VTPSIRLGEAARLLAAELGSVVAAPYVPGKTAFRDTLCKHFWISQLQAEALCDSLESSGLLCFHANGDTGPQWTIAPL
jgi:hypothetical protein